VAWSFIIPIATSIIGGAVSSGSSNTQAQGATDAANTAANAQMAGLQFVQQQEQPYNQAGQQALSRYEQLLGLAGNQGASQPTSGVAARPGQRPLGSPASGQPSSSGQPPNAGGGFDINSYLSNLPGYQFQLQQGLAGVEGSAAARGGALSGNALQGVQQYGQGLASMQFQQYMSQLAGLSSQGQAAASGVAQSGGNLIPGAGASQASGINAAAQYTAAGQLGSYNQLASGLTTAFNSPSFQQGMQSLFSPTPSYDQVPPLDPSVFAGT
jgi:hypothetical protein